MLVKIKKYIAFFLLFFAIGGFVVGAMPVPAKAQWITADIPSLSGWISDKLYKSWDKITKQLLATAFKKSLGTFLNKLAYDSAVYVASAGSGQKSLVNPFKGNYLLDLAEGATGEFIDELAQKSGFASALGTTSLCEPVDLTMKANLLMSFKKPKEPPAPKCSLTKMAIAAQKSANDNLLEFNAGYQESEGGLNITLRGITNDQLFQGTDVQDELTSIAKDFEVWFKELQGIMPQLEGGMIASATSGNDNSINTAIDFHKENLKDMQGQFQSDMNILDQITNEAYECIDAYQEKGSFCGNAVVTGTEMCDVALKGCNNSSCTLSSPGCNGGGPDAVLQSGEVCDGADLQGMSCIGLGYASGTLSCSGSCDFNVTNCIRANVITADCTTLPKCASFVSTMNPETTCVKVATTANQYAMQLFGSLEEPFNFLKNLNQQIESGTFNPAGNDIDPADIANAFNPEANEMGQFGKIQEALSEKTQAQLEHEKLKTLAEGPCKGVTKPISGEVVTPSTAACAAINEALAKSTKGQETFTGTIADAFGVFINTLTSKLMERYFKQGLSMVFDKDGLKECTGPDGKDCKNKDKTEDILRSGASLGGKASAEKALGGLLTASIESGGQQDILSILAACPPEQPALNNCIIDEPFRRAIERQLTVKEAMEAYKKSGGSEGLDPKKPFGYILVGTAMDEPDFKNGYPYRSMLYLRKYRIIPVGWELAAQYIKDIEATKQVHTLDNVVDGFDDPTSPFFGLADPAWVLKSPTVFCARQGPGPELLSSELMCEKIAIGGQCESDDYQARKVSRKTWCADEQTCLEEGESGDCKRYGYCTLEKPSWKLGGTQCDKPFASCEGYTNSITKANYTILENTLNKSDCSQSNVGCQWYCQDAPKMCVGGTRGGQPCGVNNDCASIYCSVGTCATSGNICSYDTDCDTSIKEKCVSTSRKCVNGDTPGIACTTNAQCGRGVVDGVCEEGGVWSCKAENLVADGNMEASDLLAWNTTGGCNASTDSKSTVAHSGSQSMYIAYNNLNPVCQGRGQSANLIVGKTYTLEAWVKTNGGPSNGYIYNPWPTATQWYSVDSLSEWQHISYIFVATSTSFQFGFRIRDNFTTANGVYVDDVRLYEGDRVNLDRDVKKCEAKDAGCNQFIKVLPGTNLIGNSGFEDDADATLTITGAGNGNLNRWHLENNNAANLKAEIKQTTVHSGKNSLYLEMNMPPNDFSQGLWMSDSSKNYSVVPDSFRFNPEKSYTISAWVYIDDAATGKISLTAGSPFLPPATTTQTSSQWERISLAIPAGTSINEIRIFPSAGPNPTHFYIDDLQFEEGDTTNNYVQYGSSNQAYLNGRRLSCLKEEVGCNLYSPIDGGDPIPAVVKTKDQCPAECAGYASFQELPTFFAPSGSLFENLIPKTASSCPASAEGCEEFTNLDTVASGGEAKEYYTKLRQCAKPGTTTEATFYTWEGSEEAGFQLRAWRLKADLDGSPISLNGDDCLDPADPDCRIFYDQNGITFPEELSSTIFISNDCHPLRRTIEGSQLDCTNSGGYQWDDPDGDLSGTCFYNAIPSQGLKCQVQYAGCREYRGAAGNNLRVLLNDDFEDLTSQGWTPSSLSSESLTVGGRSYNISYNIGGDGFADTGDDVYTAKKNVSDLMTQDKVYILEFWAKRKNSADITAALNARFFNGGGNILILQLPKVPIDEEWNQYSLGPMVFSRAPANDGTETLEIFPTITDTGSSCNPGMGGGCIGEYYLDNIVLREITDNPYLIKDSWKTPLSCDLDPSDSLSVTNALESAMTAAEVGVIDLQDSGGFPDTGGIVVIDGEAIQYTGKDAGDLSKLIGLTRGLRNITPAIHSIGATVWLLDEGAQLGCKEYTDRFNQKTYLRSFDYLCGEDKVGCMEMFNTYNSRSMHDQTIKGEYIPRDAVEYIVDNPKIYCNASFKGCEKLGQPALGPDQSISSWGETYLINDPDQYDQIACESNENMCSEFITRGGGTMYFKDPKEALCEYQSPINIEGTITKGWFKKGVIPAALGGLVFYDSDGIDGPDTYAHLECATTSGAWNETKWTYSCPNDQVGCTEYQTPAVSTRQDGNQYIGVVNIDTSNVICFPNTAPPSTQYCKTTPTIPSPASWQYRFDILESGKYDLALSTENYLGGDAFVAAPLGFNRHHLNIYIDGVLKKALTSGLCSTAATACYTNSDCPGVETCNNVSSPLPPPASPSAQSTMVNLGTIERGKRIVSIEWTNDWLGAIEDSNLQINSLILAKSAGVNYYNLEQGVDTSSCTGVVDPEKGCVAFYDATNPILNIKSSAVSGNAFAPAACQKCSLDANTCSTLTTCKPASENCCCTNNAAVTNPCDSNTILKVKADRQCAEWLACTESEKTTDSKGNIIEMCKKRQACYKTGDGVECASDGLVSEIKQNQTFDNPVAIDVSPLGHVGVVADANLRSGYFKAGLHWAKGCTGNRAIACQVDKDCADAGIAGTCDNLPVGRCSLDPAIVCSTNADCVPGKGICSPVIEGYYPYGQMTQRWCSNPPDSSCIVDSDCGAGNQCLPNIIAFEDDFETYQAGVVLPQCAVDAVRTTLCGDPASAIIGTCEVNKKGICLDYWSSTAVGGAKATNKEFKFGGQSLLVLEGNTAGNEIISKPIDVINGTYALTVWINTKELEPQTPGNNDPNLLVVQVIGGGIVTSQKELQDWTKYSVLFPTGVGQVTINIYMAAGGNGIKAGSKAYVDMISLAPVLEIQNPVDKKTLPDNYAASTASAYSDRSCRIFAKPDALSCKYRERNTGREIQGWRGFCAEADPKNPEYCLQWWPIDLIEGEDISKY